MLINRSGTFRKYSHTRIFRGCSAKFQISTWSFPLGIHWTPTLKLRPTQPQNKRILPLPGLPSSERRLIISKVQPIRHLNGSTQLVIQWLNQFILQSYPLGWTLHTSIFYESFKFPYLMLYGNVFLFDIAHCGDWIGSDYWVNQLVTSTSDYMLFKVVKLRVSMSRWWSYVGKQCSNRQTQPSSRLLFYTWTYVTHSTHACEQWACVQNICQTLIPDGEFSKYSSNSNSRGHEVCKD